MGEWRIGPYRILGDLGSGGMGKVYLAEVSGKVPGLDDGSRVALKVIHPHLLETPGFFKRFLREAEIGRSVRQDNVVRCLDCDAVLHEGVQQNFLVMEYVDGQTLRDLLVELEQVPEELCRHIGREVAKGLAAIHEAGVVHRDLKPENVLITKEHVVKVMDLGVARLQDEAVRLSRTGAFVGSLEYASPEQFRAGGADVDARSDLHAVGVVLYELSTGRHPYRTDDVSTTLRNVVEGRARRAGEVNPQLSPFFEEVVHTLVAHEPDERFPSASALLEALEEGEGSAWWRERAKMLRRRTRRPLRRIRIPRETALYGRDEDLVRLHGLYDKAKEGEGQVLLIEGEAGIGKTRLVDEFVGRLRDAGEDVNFLFGSYPPGGAATAAGAFSTAYREQFGSEGLEDTLRTYLEPTPILIPAFAALLRGATTPPGAAALTKESLQTVFVHATRGLAAERTTIVLIDDLHFAPEEGRALFSSLAMAVPGSRILLIGTMRPGVSEQWFAGVTRLDHAESRALPRLGPKDLGQLLRDALRSERLADELGWRIAEKSDGNPFFAFEIIRGLRESQRLRQQPDGTWLTTGAIEDIEVPSSIVDLIQARLEGLSEQEHELLDVAACVGFTFPVGLVADVVKLSRIPALRAFARLEKAHRLVRSQGRVFVFDHHQIQEVVYGGLPQELREAYHAEIACALEQGGTAGGADREGVPEDLDGALCVDLCTHYLKGARGEGALRYLDAALVYLGKGFHNDEAIELADRALSLPGLLQGEPRLRVLLRKCDRLELLGRREDQEEVLVEARSTAETLDDEAASASVDQATGVLHWTMGRFKEGLPYHERYLAFARERGDREGEIQATRNLGTTHIRLAQYDQALPCLERCLHLAQAHGDVDAEASATINLGNCAQGVGRREEAWDYYERGLELARDCGNRRWESAATGNLGNAAYALGKTGQARELQERYVALAREIGFRQGEATGLMSLGNALHTLGRFEEGLTARQQALAIAREIGDRHLVAISLVNLGPGWWNFGRLREAREILQESLAICREIGARYPEGYALWSLSQVVDEEGDRERALELALEALALRREIQHQDGLADCLLQLGQLARRAGDPATAREALEEAETLSRSYGEKRIIPAILANLACLPAGDVEAALASFEGAGDDTVTAETRMLLWETTGDPEHLREAKRLLDEHVERMPEQHRTAVLENLRLHRELLAAWAEHGDEAGGEAARD